MRAAFCFFLLFGLYSCTDLNDNLFNNDNTITAYLRDKYAGETDFILDDSYTIPDSLIHEFTLLSKTPSEKQAVKIYATYVGSLKSMDEDTVILYCHGNKWHMDFYWQRTKLLANTGGKNRFGVMTFDYRGFGLSEGLPTEEGMYADVRASLKWLKDQGVSSDRIIFYGFSLGSAPAVEFAAHPFLLKPSKLILEAPFASAEMMVKDASMLNMPASFFTSLKIDNAEEIKEVEQPLLWIHGSADDFLSYEKHGSVVYSNYRGRSGDQVKVEGANHGDVPVIMGFTNYSDTILEFILRRI